MLTSGTYCEWNFVIRQELRTFFLLALLEDPESPRCLAAMFHANRRGHMVLRLVWF